MPIEAKFAASAYQTLANLKDSLGEKSINKVVGAEDKGDFSGMVGNVLSNLTEQAHSADMKTQGLVTGKTELVDVVTAVAETQVAMETLVSVRDQIINAYEKIMQMPI